MSPTWEEKLSEKSVSLFDSRTSYFVSVSSRCRTLRVRVRIYSGEEIERERECALGSRTRLRCVCVHVSLRMLSILIGFSESILSSAGLRPVRRSCVMV